MNIRKLNEEYDEIFTAEPERLAAENAAYELRQKKKPYLYALNALEELQNSLWEGVSPVTGKLDSETEKFNQILNTAIAEIYSRSLAFD